MKKKNFFGHSWANFTIAGVSFYRKKLSHLCLSLLPPLSPILAVNFNQSASNTLSVCITCWLMQTKTDWNQWLISNNFLFIFVSKHRETQKPINKNRKNEKCCTREGAREICCYWILFCERCLTRPLARNTLTNHFILYWKITFNFRLFFIKRPIFFCFVSFWKHLGNQASEKMKRRRKDDNFSVLNQFKTKQNKNFCENFSTKIYEKKTPLFSL